MSEEEKQITLFREKYEGANTGGAISSRQMDAMVQDMRQAFKAIREEGYKQGKADGVVESANKVYQVYDAKYSHVTRDYRTEDHFRDDVHRAILEINNSTLSTDKE